MSRQLDDVGSDDGQDPQPPRGRPVKIIVGVAAILVGYVAFMGLVSAVRLQLSPHHWYVTTTVPAGKNVYERDAKRGPYDTEQQCNVHAGEVPKPIAYGWTMCEELRDDEAHVPPPAR